MRDPSVFVDAFEQMVVCKKGFRGFVCPTCSKTANAQGGVLSWECPGCGDTHKDIELRGRVLHRNPDFGPPEIAVLSFTGAVNGFILNGISWRFASQKVKVLTRRAAKKMVRRFDRTDVYIELKDEWKTLVRLSESRYYRKNIDPTGEGRNFRHWLEAMAAMYVFREVKHLVYARERFSALFTGFGRTEMVSSVREGHAVWTEDCYHYMEEGDTAENGTEFWFEAVDRNTIAIRVGGCTGERVVLSATPFRWKDFSFYCVDTHAEAKAIYDRLEAEWCASRKDEWEAKATADEARRVEQEYQWDLDDLEARMA